MNKILITDELVILEVVYQSTSTKPEQLCSHCR